MLDGRFTDVAVIMGALLTRWGVDDELDLAVGDLVGDVVGLVDLVDEFARDAGVVDHVVAAAGGEDSESEFVEGLCDFEKFGLVTIADGQKHGAFERKLHLFGCFCSFEVGFAEGLERPSTSPVERISGPRTGSTSGKLPNGKTASLTP